MGEDVELCLEVQVDPASKRILSNPEKCRSALLDVTVVKPKEVEAFGTHRTNTLRADEVRRLIASMEKQRRKKQKVLDQLRDDDTIIKIRKHDRRRPRYRERIHPTSPVDDLERKDFIGIGESIEPLFCEIRRSLKNVETRITDMQDINLVISQTTFDTSEEYVSSRRKKPNRLSPQNTQMLHATNQTVYRMETQTRDLKSLILSKDKQLPGKGDKVEGKCLCENCGVVGLLMECQKHPLLNELSESPPPSHHAAPRSHRPKPDVEHAKLDESAYVKLLSTRVKLLEQRLAAQEERVVPKDYFKKIITKMVTNFSPKIFKSKSDTSMPLGAKTKPRSPSRKAASVRSQKSSPGADRNRHSCKDEQEVQCCNVSVSHHAGFGHHKVPKNDKATTTDDDVLYGGYVWRWGEEVLRPGIDLKNRIVTLLTEMLSKSSVETTKPVKSEKYDCDGLKRVMRHMNARIFNAQIDTSGKFLGGDYTKRERVSFDPRPTSVMNEFVKKSSPEKIKRKESEKKKNIDVSYVNPKLSLWRKESPDCKEQVVETTGKQEFLKIVSKAKQHQKDVLWRNIWNQAKANGQSKKDKITIKIPSQKDSRNRQKFFETEITIGEVEEILKGV